MKDKMIHIPHEVVTTPTDGAIVMMNKWWTVYKEGHISIFTNGKEPCKHTGCFATYSPQCNSNEQIANNRGKWKAVFLPIVYFQNLLQSDNI